jgi:hypothetical protein
MDPDLVRQQAEAELEQRNGARLVKAAEIPLSEVPAAETVLAAMTEPAAPPPAVIQAPPPAAAAMLGKPSRWRIRAQAFFSSGALAALAALAAAAWGANQGLSTDEQVWLGTGAAVLMAVIYSIALSVSGNNITPAGGTR